MGMLVRGIMPKKKKDKTIEKQKRGIFTPYLKELRLAYKRMNSSPVKRLDWLLRLAYDDPSTLSAGQLADRVWEMVMFAARGAKPEELSRAPARGEIPLPALQHWDAAVLLPSDSAAQAATMRTLESFHEEMKKNFDAYFSVTGWRYTPREKVVRFPIPKGG